MANEPTSNLPDLLRSPRSRPELAGSAAKDLKGPEAPSPCFGDRGAGVDLAAQAVPNVHDPPDDVVDDEGSLNLRSNSDTGPQVAKAKSCKSFVNTLYSSAQVEVETSLESSTDSNGLKALQKATFQDSRWQNALQHMQESGAWTDEASVQKLIRTGAKAFGLWHLQDEALEALAKHLLQGEAIITPALKRWTQRVEEGENRHSKVLESRSLAEAAECARGSGTKKLQSRKGFFSTPGSGLKFVLSVVVFLLSNAYALEVVLVMYPKAIGLFGWPIYIARAGGCAALLWTALLFFSMSRTMFRMLTRCLPMKTGFHQVADCHKELHIFFGKALLVTGLVHGAAHCVGTVPGIERSTKEEINEVLGCANRETTPGYINAPMRWLALPKCPLEKEHQFEGILFKSLPGLSGLALLCVICLVAYTARKRSSHFDIFWYVHNAAIPLWLILLFLHGSQGWVGVGFPLVVLVCGLPVALYAVDRIGRTLRYYLFAGGRVRILDVVIRPGQTDVCKGGLVHLAIARPPFLWSRRFQSGMYAFLCMPEYAPLQWHPFTICSGQDDETVDFIVAGLGDWTQELARRCWNAHEQGGGLPKIAMDGPYLSPTTTALSREVLVAVGAGVGVTPLLSLMSTVVSVLERGGKDAKHLPLKEAHFFWMTRSADELLFGRKHFAKIVASPRLRDKVFLHLHVTHKAAEKDVAAYLFREAVRRQSEVDHKAFRDTSKGLQPSELICGAQLPWCWVNGSKQDILWVGSLVPSADAENELAIADAHNQHWASGHARRSTLSAGSSSQDQEEHRGGQETRKRFAKQAKARTTGLFSSMLSLNVPEDEPSAKVTGLDTYLPVVFGRPDFAKEIQAVGKARPENDVYVYVCGNDALVQSLQTVCESCNDASRACAEEHGGVPQKYNLHYERFG